MSSAGGNLPLISLTHVSTYVSEWCGGARPVKGGINVSALGTAVSPECSGGMSCSDVKAVWTEMEGMCVIGAMSVDGICSIVDTAVSNVDATYSHCDSSGGIWCGWAKVVSSKC